MTKMENKLRQHARLSIAPMMGWTDKHYRYFLRQISTHALLYTEMITAPALVRGRAYQLLDHDLAEHPVVLQLGGSEPGELAEAAQMGAEAGYQGIDLNVGCPSDRVKAGAFGAVLMKAPEHVARCVSAMIEASSIPVSVKCRLGVDEQAPETILPSFIQGLQDVGLKAITIHARKAWLKGLSPKQNREIPPLDYNLVHEMKRRFENMHMTINGGISEFADIPEHYRAGMDGVMIGRAAYHTPYDILADADRTIFASGETVDRETIARSMVPYIDAHCASGGNAHDVTRHMLGLFTGQAGARIWRRHLSEQARHANSGKIIMEALDIMAEAASRDAA